MRALVLRAAGVIYAQMKKKIGTKGEEAASGYLEFKGYRIVERNFYVKQGEIDIIAFDGEALCFIEVKTKTTKDFGKAEEWVDARKQRQIARVAGVYLLGMTAEPAAMRFDVVAVTLDDDRDCVDSVKLLKDAFYVDGAL